MLEISNLKAGYGGAAVLSDVTLGIDVGVIVTLLGPNGAGKSTTLRCIAGLLAPRGGSITLDKEDIGGMAAHQVVRKGISLVPERRELFPNLPVHENLLLGAYVRNDNAGIRSDLDMVFSLFPRLHERRTQTAQTLSGGEQQMLAIGRGLMSRPRYLLLDEPSLGLAPQRIDEIFERIAQIRSAGTAILLVEQNAVAALEVADYGYVIEAGEIRLHGTAETLSANPAVQAAYLQG
jgi:branched-chain amino acid transport system ATP-binding protein